MAIETVGRIPFRTAVLDVASREFAEGRKFVSALSSWIGPIRISVDVGIADGATFGAAALAVRLGWGRPAYSPTWCARMSASGIRFTRANISPRPR